MSVFKYPFEGSGRRKVGKIGRGRRGRFGPGRRPQILVESLESRIVLSDPTVAINGIAITLNAPGPPRSRAP